MTFSTSEVAVCCSSDSERSSVRCRNSFEQPRVLDGDHRLGREVRHQFDLLVGERQHFLLIDADRADQIAFLEHRHDDKERMRASSTPATIECVTGVISGFRHAYRRYGTAALCRATQTSALAGVG